MENKIYRNVLIKSTGSYCPTKSVSNEDYIKHYKKQNKEKSFINLMGKLGVKQRKLTQEGEDTISMSMISTREALNKANLLPTDIDIIISATNTPEYLTPCCAILLRDKLKSTAKLCYDLNCDCIGMLHGIDQAQMYLKTNKNYKRALIVGSFMYTKFASNDNIVTHGALGDNSMAIILEVKEEPIERGFMGSTTYTDSSYNEYIRFPRCGLTKTFNNAIAESEKLVDWKPFNANIFSEVWQKIITEQLKEINKLPSEVEDYFMSQFSKEQISITMNKLKVPMNKAVYIGYKYGYTGMTSPLLALHLRLRKKSYKKGDVCVFCSVGAGFSMTALAYKW